MTSGDITQDGEDIREVKQHELREKLGYVPQKGVLFSGDIASNIMFGNSHGSDDEMIEAAEIAQATEFIDTKPEKYKSPISQGGANVSGGQKQRVAIAEHWHLIQSFFFVMRQPAHLIHRQHLLF